jgi:hypothetical protein
MIGKSREIGEDSVQSMGLYYPFIRFRNWDWVKVAVLYWPKIARIVPDGYQQSFPYEGNPEFTELQSELDFIVDIRPGVSVDAVSGKFLELLADHESDLQRLYRIRDDESDLVGHQPPIHTPLPSWAANTPAVPNELSPHGTTEVHVAELSEEARQALIDADLAAFPVLGADGTSNWVSMRAELAWAYKCLLSEDVAHRNSLEPTTDQAAADALTGQWSVRRMAEYLLGAHPETTSLAASGPGEVLGLLALSLVIPADLHACSMRRIIELRKSREAEFVAFKSAISQLVADLSETIATIEDPVVLLAYFEQEVNDRVRRPGRELQEQLRSSNFGAVGLVANMRFDAPVGIAVAAAMVGRPLVAAVGAAAAGVISVGRGVRQRRQEILAPSAASYLLHVQRDLEPKGALKQAMDRLGWMAGLHG